MNFYPPPKAEAKRAHVFTRHEFLHALRVASITRQAERNQLLICLSHGCGLRVTELSRVTVADVMFSSGQIRDEITLRASITKRSKSRTIPFANKLLRQKPEAYIAYRIENDIGMELDGKSYRSLVPAMPLIYSDRGTPFQLSAKVRKMRDGRSERYWACDTLERTFAALYKMSGIKGGSSHSGRRSFATRVMEATCDIELVSRLLGHDDIDHTWPYLEPNMKAIRHAYESALDGVE